MTISFLSNNLDMPTSPKIISSTGAPAVNIIQIILGLFSNEDIKSSTLYVAVIFSILAISFVFSAVLLYTITRHPFSANCRAIPCPIFPNPIMPISFSRGLL